MKTHILIHDLENSSSSHVIIGNLTFVHHKHENVQDSIKFSTLKLEFDHFFHSKSRS